MGVDQGGVRHVNQLVKSTKNPTKYLSLTELIVQTVSESWLDKYARHLCGTKAHNELIENMIAQLRDHNLIRG